MAAELKPGDRVRVTLDNGYTDTGTVVRVYKNGRVGVREDRYKAYYVRSVVVPLKNEENSHGF